MMTDKVFFAEFGNGARVMLPARVRNGKGEVLPAWPVDGVATEKEYFDAMKAANGGIKNFSIAKLNGDDERWPYWATPTDWTKKRKLEKDNLLVHRNAVAMIRKVEQIEYSLR